MVVEDPLIIAGFIVLGSAIATMWVYYNRRIAKLEEKLQSFEKARLAEYTALLMESFKLNKRCAEAMDRMSSGLTSLLQAQKKE